MLRVGLTGGLATGKTFVGKTLREYGCHLFQADEIGHQVLGPDGPAFSAVVAEFGDGILTGGRIDRRALAGIVFADPEKLKILNGIVHPHVIDIEEARVRAIGVREPGAIIVIEAAILIETGSYRRCQKLILTVCPEDEQIRRAVARDGYSEAEARARIARQMPLREKKTFADYIIETIGSLEETRQRTRAVFEELRSIP